jgi:FkbM family methyltransferase
MSAAELQAILKVATCLPRNAPLPHGFFLGRRRDAQCSNIGVDNGQKQACACSDLLELSGKSPSGRFGGSVLNLSKSTRHVDAAKLHSTKGHHIIKGVNRTGWVPILTQQVSSWFYPQIISNLPCSPSRGEDAVVFRTFFVDNYNRMIPTAGSTFLELGAYDGIEESNTWFFQNCLGWDGVLIEAQPHSFNRIGKVRPGVSSVHAAVCTSSKTVHFSRRAGTDAKIVASDTGIPVPCAPLSLLLGQANKSRIDFFSLDVEGAEPHVIRTMGAYISYGVVIVEVSAGHRRQRTMHAMLAKGFWYAGQMSTRPSSANFVMSDVFFNLTHMRLFYPRSRAVHARFETPH